MIARYDHLTGFPRVFRSLTGLRVSEFETLLPDLLPAFTTAELQRHTRPDRQRAPGAGPGFELAPRDQILLTVVWLRQYLIHEVLGFLFGVSDSTVSRTLARVLPLLEAHGQTHMRMPDPGRKKRRDFDALLADLPDLFVVIDSLDQKIQRPADRKEADRY
jgi:hypothetical protein